MRKSQSDKKFEIQTDDWVRKTDLLVNKEKNMSVDFAVPTI